MAEISDEELAETIAIYKTLHKVVTYHSESQEGRAVLMLAAAILSASKTIGAALGARALEAA